MDIKAYIETLSEKAVVKETIEFNQGANPLAIEAFAIKHHAKLPDTLNQLWSVTDGESDSSDGFLGGQRLVGIKESAEIILNHVSNLEDSPELGELRYAKPYMKGECKYFEQGWVPIGSLDGSDIIVIDCRPDFKPVVFEWSAESGPARLFGQTLVEFLDLVAAKVVKDGYIKAL